jgi:branched-chain amino acid transport system permease protein
MILQFLANGLVAGAVYSIVALGFSLIYNATKVFHIAHGAVYTTSAYIFYSFYRMFGLPLSISILGGLLAGIILGILMEIGIYRQLYEKRAPSGISLVSSIGIYILVVNFIALVYGNETKVLSPGIGKTYEIGNIIVTRIQVYEVIVFIIIFVLYFLLLKKTNFGRLIKALANNPTLLSTFGVEASALRIGIFSLGSLFAGISSCLVALDVGIDPHVGMPALLISAVAMIIGGIGVFESAAIGGFIIGILQNLVVWRISSRWQEAVTFILLIIFLLLRPQGILGTRRRVEEA